MHCLELCIVLTFISTVLSKENTCITRNSTMFSLLNWYSLSTSHLLQKTHPQHTQTHTHSTHFKRNNWSQSCGVIYPVAVLLVRLRACLNSMFSQKSLTITNNLTRIFLNSLNQLLLFFVILTLMLEYKLWIFFEACLFVVFIGKNKRELPYKSKIMELNSWHLQKSQESVSPLQSH